MLSLVRWFIRCKQLYLNCISMKWEEGREGRREGEGRVVLVMVCGQKLILFSYSLSSLPLYRQWEREGLFLHYNVRPESLFVWCLFHCVFHIEVQAYLNVLISFSHLQWQRSKSVSIFQLKWTLFMLTHLMKPLYCIQGSIRGEHREREEGEIQREYMQLRHGHVSCLQYNYYLIYAL